mmetsp:Transcript_96032/g.170435  ORF Transcript_96032/g.170435 Transcript_96032/m.170435 type:complete len:274 (+) Transcript_96032:93-914(+)
MTFVQVFLALLLGAGLASEVCEDEHCDSPTAEVAFLQVDLDVEKDKEVKMTPQFEQKMGEVHLPGRKQADLKPSQQVKRQYEGSEGLSKDFNFRDKSSQQEELPKPAAQQEMVYHGDLNVPEPAEMLQADSEETLKPLSKGWLKRLLTMKSAPFPQSMSELKKKHHTAPKSKASEEEQQKVLLTQLVASSFVGEQKAATKDSISSLLINVLVLTLVFALGVLLYTNGWNWSKTVEEVERDPKLLYNQFKEGQAGSRVLQQDFGVGRKKASDCC